MENNVRLFTRGAKPVLAFVLVLAVSVLVSSGHAQDASGRLLSDTGIDGEPVDPSGDPALLGWPVIPPAAVASATFSPVDSSSAAAPIASVVGAREHRTPVATQHQDSQQVDASSDHYSATFSAAGLRIATIADNSPTVPGSPWSFTLLRISRGNTTLWAGSASHPELNGETVTYRRGDILERYSLQPTTIEQEFVIPTMPSATGDLVLSAQVSTSLQSQASSGAVIGLRFEDPTGSGPPVSYGRAVARDNAGRAVPVPYELLPGGLVNLVVPSDWLATAEAPITIDPLIGGNFAASQTTSSFHTRTTIAYNSSADEYMVAYVDGSNNVKVTRVSNSGTILNPTGLTLGTTYANGAGAIPMRPYVVYSETSINKYLVVWSDSSKILTASILNANGGVLTTGTVYSSPGKPQHRPCAAYDPTRDRWLIVWDQPGTFSTTLRVYAKCITTGGVIDSSPLAIHSGAKDYFNPAVAYSGAGADTYVLGYNDNYAGSGQGNFFRLLSGDKTTLGANTSVFSSFGQGSDYNGSLAWNELESTFVYAFESGGYSSNAKANAYLYSANGTSISGTQLTTNFDTAESQLSVAYNKYFNHFLVVANRLNPPTGTQAVVWIFGTPNALIEGPFVVSTGSQAGRPFVASGPQRWRTTFWNTSAYGQDVESLPPPKVIRVDPPKAATGAFLDQNIVLDFNVALKSATVTTSTIKLTQAGSPVAASVSYLSGSYQVSIDPSSNLASNTTYTVTVTTGLQNSYSTFLSAECTTTFTTGAVIALADSDGDGLLDVEELAIGTCPTEADTDGDGLTDGAELCGTHTDPTRVDTDGDGANDSSDANPLSPNPGAPDTTAPLLIGLFPSNNTSDIALGIPAKAKFNEPVNISSVTSSNFVVKNVTDGNVAISGDYSLENGTVVVFKPLGGWPAGKTISVEVVGGATGIRDGLEGPSGNHVQVGMTSQFTTRSISSETLSIEPPHYIESILDHIDMIDINALQDPALDSKTVGDNGTTTVAQTPTGGMRDQVTNPPTHVKICSCRMGADGKMHCVCFVVPATMALLFQAVDFQSEGVSAGRSLHFLRTFRNTFESEGVFGWNWAFSYDMKFEQLADQNADTFADYRLTDYDGRTAVFLSSGASSFTAPSGYYDVVKVASNIVKLRTRDGHRFVFDLNKGGLLTDIYDRCENHVTLTRTQNVPTGKWRLTQIVDELGRTITIAYHPSGATDTKRDLVQTVTDWNSSVWTYDYNGDRDLVTVTSPASDWLNDAGTPQSNTGKTVTYTYTSGLGGTMDHSLTSVTDGRGNVVMRAAYDPNDHVLQLDHGGGTAFYSPDWTAGGFSVEKATEIDRAGNVTEFRNDANLDADRITKFTAGFHAGEPACYVTKMKHNSNHELTQIIHPRCNVERFILTSQGFIRQRILKTNTASSPDTDIVDDYKIDSTFGVPLRHTEPRGNTTPVASTATAEDVDAQTPRTFTVSDPTQRDAYTTYSIYDHENVTSRLSTETSEMGVTVSLTGALPKSFGRPTGTDPPDTTNVFKDLDSDSLIDHGGNLYVVRAPRPRVVDPTTPSSFQASRQVIEQFQTYNQRGQRIFRIAPDGTRDRYEWVAGNYNVSTNPNAGLLKLVQVDSSFGPNDVTLSTGIPSIANPGGRLDLTTQFAYDVVGNTTSVTNPRGFVTNFVVNRLNLVTEVTSPAPFSYQRKFSFDGANNLVRLQVQNVTPNDSNDNGVQDSSGEQSSGSPAFFTHTFKFNATNSLITQTLDATGSNPSSLVTTYQRDFKQRVTRVTKPELNYDSVYFDERDLVYKTVRGESDSTVSSTTKLNYDANGNLATVIDDDGNVNADLTYTYDLFDRAMLVTDEIGNSVETKYDPGSFVRQVIPRGQKTGTPAEATTTILGQSFFEYDELGRMFQGSAAYFDVVAGTALVHGSLTPPVNNTSSLLMTAQLVSALRVFDATSLTTHSIDDNVHKTTLTYDGAHRLLSATDHIGSSKTYTYDKASNLIRVRDIDLDGDTLTSTTFYNEAFYDELDRTIATVSNLGNTRRFLWDSRGNLMQTADAMGTQTGNMSGLRTAAEHGTFPQTDLAINARGNTTQFTYDGLSRPLLTARHLRTGGTGAGTVSSILLTGQTWDGNSRCKSRTDAKSNATTFCYDNLDRVRETTYADTRETHTAYNRSGTVKLVRDPRNVITQFAYDVAERVTDVAVSNLPYGQGQTTFLAYQYDGLGRTKRAEDNDSITLFNFDSLSRTIQETQSIGTSTPRTLKTDSLTGLTRNVSKVFDGVGNRKQLTYPGGQVIDYTYDAVDRLDLVKDGATNVADYRYVGMGGRRVQRSYANGTALSLSYDGERRVTRYDHRRTSDGLRVRGFEYAWDRENNRRYEQRLTVNTNTTETAGAGEFALYDSIYRLTRFRKDVATGGLDAMANNATSVSEPSSTRVTDYVLDGANNRTSVTVDSVATAYAMQAGLPTLDGPVNQYTTVGTATLSHDDSGNMLNNGSHAYFWDFADRMVQLITATEDVRYFYDALGRRIAKRLQTAGTKVLYWWDGWQCLEETNETPTVVKKYVYGTGIDEPLRVTMPDYADVDNDANVSELVDLYYHDNSIGSIVALTKSDGAVVEAYRYDAYGAVEEIRDKSGNVVASGLSPTKNALMFQGRQLDFEEGSGLYYFRNRYYSPSLGRFVSRDPKGIWGDAGQLGNGQSAFGNNPLNRVDPFGLDDKQSPFGLDQSLDADNKSGDYMNLKTGEMEHRTGPRCAIPDRAKAMLTASLVLYYTVWIETLIQGFMNPEVPVGARGAMAAERAAATKAEAAMLEAAAAKATIPSTLERAGISQETRAAVDKAAKEFAEKVAERSAAVKCMAGEAPKDWWALAKRHGNNADALERAAQRAWDNAKAGKEPLQRLDGPVTWAEVALERQAEAASQRALASDAIKNALKDLPSLPNNPPGGG